MYFLFSCLARKAQRRVQVQVRPLPGSFRDRGAAADPPTRDSHPEEQGQDGLRQVREGRHRLCRSSGIDDELGRQQL